jgi:hypothetical protein
MHLRPTGNLVIAPVPSNSGDLFARLVANGDIAEKQHKTNNRRIDGINGRRLSHIAPQHWISTIYVNLRGFHHPHQNMPAYENIISNKHNTGKPVCRWFPLSTALFMFIDSYYLLDSFWLIVANLRFA